MTDLVYTDDIYQRDQLQSGGRKEIYLHFPRSEELPRFMCCRAWQATGGDNDCGCDPNCSSDCIPALILLALILIYNK